MADSVLNYTSLQFHGFNIGYNNYFPHISSNEGHSITDNKQILWF
jgi:hypothetical protein